MRNLKIYPLYLDKKILGLFAVGKFEPMERTEECCGKARKILEELRKKFPYKDCLQHAEDELNQWKEKPEESVLHSDEDIEYYFDNVIRQGISRVDKSIDIMHEQRRNEREREFWAKSIPSNGYAQGVLQNALENFRNYINSEYVGIFLSNEPRDAYLPLVAMANKRERKGVLPNIYIDRHKASIPEEILNHDTWNFQRYQQNVRQNALLGADANDIKDDIFLFVPFSHMGHCGALCMGPLKQSISEDDKDALRKLVFNLSLQIAGIYLQNSYKRRQRNELLGFSLFVHGLKRDFHKNLSILSYLERFMNKKFVSEWGRGQKAIHDLKTSFDKMTDDLQSGLKSGGTLALLHYEKTKKNSFQSDTPYHLESLLRNVIASFEKEARNSQMQIQVSGRRTQNGQVRVDSAFLREIVGNLLDNAIKYGKSKGEILVNWKLAGKNFIRVEITGPGKKISSVQRKELFKSGSSEISNNLSSGFGLSLVKEAAEVWGGDAGVNSKELMPLSDDYQTHTFWFTIPQNKREVLR